MNPQAGGAVNFCALMTREKQQLHERGVRAVAVFEAAKGTLVLAAGCGLLSLLHRDLQAMAEHLVRLSHLNPARHYPRVFIEAATRVDDHRIKTLAALAFLYSVVRFVEAYGLWRLRAWAEWFAIISGAIYIPIEAYELFQRPTPVRAAVLLINLGIVAYLLYFRWESHKIKLEKKREATTAPETIATS